MFFLTAKTATEEAVHTLEVFQRVSDLPQEIQALLTASGKPWWDPLYLKCIEEHNQGIETYYGLILKGDVPAAICYYQAVNFKGEDLAGYLPEPSANCNFAAFIWRKSLDYLRSCFRKMEMKLLVSGNIFITGDNGWLCFNQDEEPNKIFHLRDVADRIAKSRSDIRSILLSDLNLRDKLSFKPTWFNWIETEPDMHMDIQPGWHTLEDYLSDMSSKYRVRARKVLKESEEIQVRELDTQACHDLKDELHCLYLNVVENATFNLATLQAGYFFECKQRLGDQFRVHGFFLEDQLVGFMSSFDHNTTLEVHFMGIDYRKNRKYRLYQRMLYQMIETTILDGYRKVHLGRTAQEIKSTVGAEPASVYGLLQHRNKLSNTFFFGPLTNHLKPKSYVIRKPFK